jgi:hypothetical protein
VSELYRKYSRYPLIRRRVYRFRMNHDAWAWVLVALMILAFVALEWVR